ncbi:hypothetical protein AB4Z39_16795 [Mycobacterium adipatum]|uniref:hypothetical protein n=1 Tax=Mycobacterium adipatum TaxID=1682113 RepID=UPI0034E05B69
MGYSASSVDNDFRVPADAVDAALSALRHEFGVHHPTLTQAVEDLTSFQECSQPSRDDDFVLGYHCDTYFPATDKVLDILGRHATEGSYVRLIGADDCLFGFRVVDGQLRAERGSFTWALSDQEPDPHGSGPTTEGNEYLVGWVIDIQADSHEQAARKALRIQRDPNSIATVFEVQRRHGTGGAVGSAQSVDLSEIDGLPTL